VLAASSARVPGVVIALFGDSPRGCSELTRSSRCSGSGCVAFDCAKEISVTSACATQLCSSTASLGYTTMQSSWIVVDSTTPARWRCAAAAAASAPAAAAASHLSAPCQSIVETGSNWSLRKWQPACFIFGGRLLSSLATLLGLSSIA